MKTSIEEQKKTHERMKERTRKEKEWIKSVKELVSFYYMLKAHIRLKSFARSQWYH